MIGLVTVDEAKRHLRIDDDSGSDDSDIEMKIYAASRAVLNYISQSDPDFLDSFGEPFEDSSGSVDIPFDVKAATLLLLGDLYKERDAVNTAEWEHGYLPKSVLSLLYPYRMPSLA